MKSITWIILFCAIPFRAICQEINGNEIVFRVDTMKITSGEFLYELNKNNYSKEKLTRQDIDDYLKLYIRFKLKVRDAYANGYDTTASFAREFNIYKNQLDDSYLTNDKWLDSLTRMVYNRLKWEIRASHIFINVPDQALPADTLQAYQKIEKIYRQAISGVPFETLARKYSEDPTASYNAGDIGFFTALQLVLPFENTAYHTPVDSVSKPIRTKFGYHILKVTDRKPNPGTVTVADILFRFNRGMTKNDSANTKHEAFDLYSRLLNGGDWDKLCSQYSEDNNTRNNGGVLPSFGAGKMVPAFAQAAFALARPGDISPPVETPYGWHIIKLINKQPLQSYDDINPQLRERIRQDERYSMVKDMYLDQIAREDNLKINEQVLDRCISLVDSTLTGGHWNKDLARGFLSQDLMTINSNHYNVGDFMAYVSQNGQPQKSASPDRYMEQLFSGFREKSLTDYERSHLADKYPDYPWLVKEYREGILMFDLMDARVWEKAAQDSTGMEEYYKKNRERYKRAETAEATIVMTNDTSVLNDIVPLLNGTLYPCGREIFSVNIRSGKGSLHIPDSLYGVVLNKPDQYLMVRGNRDNIELFKNTIIPQRQYKPAEFVYSTDEKADSLTFQLFSSSKKKLVNLFSGIPGLILRIDTGNYEKGTNHLLNLTDWKAGNYYLSLEDSEYYVMIHKIDPPAVKTLDEARGEVMADYQKYLENAWMDELKNKYPVKINKKILKKIYHKFEK